MEKHVRKTDGKYPVRFRDFDDAPEILYYLGQLPDESRKTVLITGARFCSSYGRYVARQYGFELAKRGYQIITNMSLGVSGIAAKAAIDAGGDVYAVLGCGADVCYPPEHMGLYGDIKEHGGVISSYKWGTEPKPHRFVERNRILAALSDIVVVIEARKHSGTLEAADIALAHGRSVYAVPGRVTDRLSDGTNELLRRGAALMTLSPQDVDFEAPNQLPFA